MDEPLGECKGIQTGDPSVDVIEHLLKQEKEKNAVLTEQLNCAETRLNCLNRFKAGFLLLCLRQEGLVMELHLSSATVQLH